jgi:hypothetical protein
MRFSTSTGDIKLHRNCLMLRAKFGLRTSTSSGGKGSVQQCLNIQKCIGSGIPSTFPSSAEIMFNYTIGAEVSTHPSANSVRQQMSTPATFAIARILDETRYSAYCSRNYPPGLLRRWASIPSWRLSKHTSSAEGRF